MRALPEFGVWGIRDFLGVRFFGGAGFLTNGKSAKETQLLKQNPKPQNLNNNVVKKKVQGPAARRSP